MYFPALSYFWPCAKKLQKIEYFEEISIGDKAGLGYDNACINTCSCQI